MILSEEGIPPYMDSILGRLSPKRRIKREQYKKGLNSKKAGKLFSVAFYSYISGHILENLTLIQFSLPQ